MDPDPSVLSSSLPPILAIGALLAGGLGLGFANTLASAGSAVSLPLLLALGLGAEVANGTNRVAVLVGAVVAAVTFARSGVVDWRRVLPLAGAVMAGSIAGALLSEAIPPSRLQFAVVAALFVACGLLLLRPKRWLVERSEAEPRTGPLQLALLALIGVWLGFIVLDGATYLLFALVMAVGFDLLRANGAKAVLIAASALVSVPLLASGGSVDWVAAGILSIGAMAGGYVAARIAMRPGISTWVFRLLVVIIVGEVLHLAVQSIRFA